MNKKQQTMKTEFATTTKGTSRKNDNGVNLNNLTHHLLIATPQMPDPRFEQAVIYICRHDQQGALGLIINHPFTETTIGKLFEDLDIDCQYPDISNEMALCGGPTYSEVGFVLHTGQPDWASSFAISENVCITTSRDILQSIATEGGVGKFRLCLGHANWSKKQLHDEIKQGDWLVCPADLPLLFSTVYDEIWHLAGEKIGVKLDYLSPDIGHA